jgi:hypothetical protein
VDGVTRIAVYVLTLPLWALALAGWVAGVVFGAVTMFWSLGRRDAHSLANFIWGEEK